MTHLWTIGFQVVNFLLLLFLLHRYLWKPVRATIDQRKKSIDDADASLKAREKAADGARVAADAKNTAADQERARQIDATTKTLDADRDKVLAQAHALAATERTAAITKLDEERNAVASELTNVTLDLALSLAKRLLSNVSAPAVTTAFLDRLCERVEKLPEAQLASLRAEIAAGGKVQVATTPALDDDAKKRAQARLARSLGESVPLEFIVDDSLLAGAELRFPHARFGHSFQHGLAAAREEIIAHAAKNAERPKLSAHAEIADA